MSIFDFTGPDGKGYTVNGPDGATSAQAFSILQSHLGSQQQPQAAPSPSADVLPDVMKSAGVGLGEGVIGLAGLPGDVRSLASSATDKIGGALGASSETMQSIKDAATRGFGNSPITAPFAYGPTSQDLQNAVEGVTGKFYEPQTTAGKYARTIGQFAPAAIGGPESLLSRVATRVVAPAVTSEAAGQLTQGTGLEPYARLGGALAGAGLPSAAGRAISPATIAPERQAAVDVLNNAGVNLTAGQKTGSRALQYMESELGDAFGAGNRATKANEQALEQFTAASFNKAGINGVTRGTPEVMDAALENNSNAFNSIAARNPSIPLVDFKNGADAVISDFKSSTNSESAPALEAFVNKITGTKPSYSWPIDKKNLVSQLQSQGVSDAEIAKTLGVKPSQPASNAIISGEAYQTIQSQIAKAARSATDPNLKLALYDLRATLDKSIQAGLRQSGNARDADAWLAARSQYKNLLVLERALAKTGESASTGLITPAALGEADKAVSGRRAYVRGSSNYSELSHAGNTVMKPLPQSGTAPRVAAHIIPSVLGAAAGAGLGGVAGIAAGAAAPALTGRALMSRPIQSYLSNQMAGRLRGAPLRQRMLVSGLMARPALNAPQ